VRDVVEVLPKLLADPDCAGKVLNVGGDRPIEIGALARLVRDTLQSSSPIVQVPYEEAFGPGFDDLYHRQPDLTRLRKLTGFHQRVELDQTIRDLAEELRGCLESTI
jgi:UDP-glucose 4-epimerase